MPPYRKHLMHGTIWGPESARPTAAAANGGVYYNTTAGTWQISNGTSWSDLAAGGGPSPSGTVASETTYGASASAGSASAYSRGDHTHGTPALGTTAATACAGNDSRLSDARTPTAHDNTAHSTAYQATSEKGLANGYASLGSDGKVPSVQLPAASGDPYTVVRITSDFSTNSGTSVGVTGLYFTPAANKRYLVSIYLLLRTATATVGPRPGANFPTGMSDFGCYFQAPNSAVANAFRNWGPSTANQNAASTGLADTSSSWLAIGEAYVVTGASPSGNFQVTLASETAGTTVYCKIDSFLMYREIA
jgi:hypothetical protein